MSKVQIEHRYTDAVLFECDVSPDVESGMAMRNALEQAVSIGANLDGAYLDGANLAGAYLAGANLVGDRPIFQIGPIGSRSAYLVSYITDKGVLVTAGCFREKTLQEFREKLEQEHGDNIHAKEYKAAIKMIEAHASLWSGKEGGAA